MASERRRTGGLTGLIVLCTLMLTVSSCDILNLGTGSDPTSHHSNRHHLIPDAESLDAGLPDRTESEILATLDVSEMGVFKLALDGIPEKRNFVNISDWDYSNITSLLNPDTMYTLCDQGSVPESFLVHFNTGLGGYQTYEVKNPLAQSSPRMPYMRMRRFFKKVSQAEIPYGTSQEVTNEWTQGVETSVAQSVTETLSIESSVEVGKQWPLLSASASVSVKEEFSKTTTSTETVFGQESKSETVSFTPEEQGTYIYATWQTVDVVEFVDEDGEPWDVSDLGWDFKQAVDNDGRNDLYGFVSRVPLSVDKRVTKDVFY